MFRMLSQRLALLAVLVAGVSGCSSLPTEPPLENPLHPFFESTPTPAQGVAKDWWQSLNEPQLSALIEKALTDNFTVKAALARLSAAGYIADGQTASLFPSISGDIKTTEQRTGKYQTGTQSQGIAPSLAKSTSVRASWEVPLFGRAQAITLYSSAQLRKAALQVEAAKLLTATEVARNYLLIRHKTQELDDYQRMLEATEQMISATERLISKGAVPRTELSRVLSQRADISQATASLRAELNQHRYKLATLTGQREADPVANGTTMVPNLPTTVSANVVRTRPDVRILEEDVLAASAQAGIAKANLYPQLSLGGEITLTQGRMDSYGLSKGTSVISMFSTGLHIPLFDWFSLNAKANAQEAVFKAVVFEYRQGILAAWEDIQSVYAEYGAAKTRLMEANLKAQESLRISEDTRKLVAKGGATQVQLTNEELTRLRANVEATRAQAELLEAWLKVVKAQFSA